MPLERTSLDPALRQRIDSLLAAHRVVLFMKGEPRAPQCGFSAKAIGALNGLGIDYAHVDVLADADIREGIKAYGEWPTIPQLYVDGELIGGSDIIEQMANSGELNTTLGLPPPDRTPPTIGITPAAFEMLHKALGDAGSGYSLKIDIDATFNARLQLAPVDDNAIGTEIDGIEALEALPKATPLAFLCHHGGRSAQAAEHFRQAGFTEVYNVLEGFEGPLDDEHHRSTQSGWRKEGLPWEQC
jgi:Grx4 family monothiol glutaredoxin